MPNFPSKKMLDAVKALQALLGGEVSGQIQVTRKYCKKCGKVTTQDIVGKVFFCRECGNSS